LNNTTKRITRIAVFAALALILSLVESFLEPLLWFAPGAKMGLSNVAALVAIVILGYTDAAIIQVTRCILGGFITGGVMGIVYSLPAGIISLVGMALLYRFAFPKVSLLGISFFGAILNNITQVSVASLVIKENLAPMLPVYVLASIAAGLFVGIVSFFVVKYLPKGVYLR
jgi:heptaprenyl diphosphate synthase